MTTPASPAKAPVIPLNQLVTALSDKTRWRIFAELLKSEALPVVELSRRLGVPATNISKHVTLLRNFKLLDRGYGNLYRIPAHFLVPGENTVDFGQAVLRLDRVEQK
jgi:hypothetical protein